MARHGLAAVSGKGRLSGPGSLGAAGDISDLAGSGRHGSLSGPGSLHSPATMSTDAVAAEGQLPGESLAEFAIRHHLVESAARPPVLTYIQRLWQRRHFIVGFATARNVAMYSEARLGQVWQILTPLLNVVVYFLIFGLILNTSRGVPNFIAFLVIGIFIFNFTQRSVIVASRVMHDSLPLIRALYFPRASLPLGYVLIELQQMLIALAVLATIVLATGEPLTWNWLLVLPAIALQSVFNVGVALLLAWIGAGLDDVSQLIPFIVRTWMYASGVMFAIPALSALYLHRTISFLMQINPAAVYIGLVRDSLLTSWRNTLAGYAPYNRTLCNAYFKTKNAALENHCHLVVGQGSLWLWGIGWAVLAVVIGFFFFWRAEVTYGRG